MLRGVGGPAINTLGLRVRGIYSFLLKGTPFFYLHESTVKQAPIYTYICIIYIYTYIPWKSTTILKMVVPFGR